VFTVSVNWLSYQSPVVIDIASNPFVLPSRAEFELRAKSAVASTPVTANMSGILIPNEYISGVN
jgi:hypothetical protein